MKSKINKSRIFKEAWRRFKACKTDEKLSTVGTTFDKACNKSPIEKYVL